MITRPEQHQMNRTLIEILSGLAVIVILASFYHQIGQLRVHNKDVVVLRQMVEEAIADVGSKQEIDEVRRQLLANMETKLGRLEGRLANASATGRTTEKLQRQLEETQREADRFKVEIERDVMRTREIVDAYQEAVQAVERKAEDGLLATRNDIQQLSGRVLPDRHVLTRTMLMPTVQLNGEDTVGSGTIIFSGVNPKTRKIESYVLTSYHVVRNILADSPKSARDGIAITIYRDAGNIEVRGDMITHNRKIDAALMRLRSQEVLPHVAAVSSREESDRVSVWDPICAVGCPLGNDPIPTQGEISSTRNELGGSNYWMINAAAYFGNSGGGVYSTESRELIGVFSKIYTHGLGTATVIPHMGLCTPLPLIREWLEEQEMDWVLNSEKLDAARTVAATPR